MIRINLVKNQVPTHIDLPRKKRSYKFIAGMIAASSAIFVLIVVVVYFVFIKGSQKITVQKPTEHVVKTKINKNGIKTEKRLEIKNKIVKEKISPKEHTLEHIKEKNTAATKPETNNKTTQHESVQKTEEKHEKEENKEVLAKLKKTVLPVFSLDIKLSKIPKPVNKNSSQNELYKEIIGKKGLKRANDNITGSIAQKNKNSKGLVYVKIKTTRAFLLKKYLDRMKIKYTSKKKVYRAFKVYDIFVGGLDSYPKIVKFAKDLKSKGYSLYKVSNIDLLFYVCIDKNVNKKIKDRYIKVWSKTPFRILAIAHKKVSYIYVFEFRCTKSQLNLLKKKGYYPIIERHSKSGA